MGLVSCLHGFRTPNNHKKKTETQVIFARHGVAAQLQTYGNRSVQGVRLRVAKTERHQAAHPFGRKGARAIAIPRSHNYFPKWSDQASVLDSFSAEISIFPNDLLARNVDSYSDKQLALVKRPTPSNPSVRRGISS